MNSRSCIARANVFRGSRYQTSQELLGFRVSTESTGSADDSPNAPAPFEFPGASLRSSPASYRLFHLPALSDHRNSRHRSAVETAGRLGGLNGRGAVGEARRRKHRRPEAEE
jgi:hypothetical protein